MITVDLGQGQRTYPGCTSAHSDTCNTVSHQRVLKVGIADSSKYLGVLVDVTLWNKHVATPFIFKLT